MRAVQETIKTQPRDFRDRRRDNSNTTSNLASSPIVTKVKEWLKIVNRGEHIVEDNPGFMWFGTQPAQPGMDGPTGAAAK
jgi:hypothetical protein